MIVHGLPPAGGAKSVYCRVPRAARAAAFLSSHFTIIPHSGHEYDSFCFQPVLSGPKKTGPRGVLSVYICCFPVSAAVQAMLSISESIWKYLRYSDLLAAGAESYEAIISQLLIALKYALTLSPGAAYSTLALIAAIMLEYAT